MSERFGYLIGVGSNLSPRDNCEQVVGAVLACFGRLSLSSAVHTEPVGVSTPNAFINLMLYIETDWPAERLKDWTNALEERLGRDRSHPERKMIDRPADLDTLQQLVPGQALQPELIRESYYRDIVRELAAHLEGAAPRPTALPVCRLRLMDGSEVGDGAATIHLDRATGRIGIVQ
ncbi:2-amino-4-hydroxy-6-hydroxymethyldihydropteridine diphosphokinase [Aestuariirhabdus litorea]|uniref:2-amino-4-hydroxy-6- hydroxymethyldihydropteridine diphosphokinase n=1 Tax=Aestuariirhabdus litorea TaxID=2528527 RepID=UPI0013E293CE|nr:2-amino-4-hydroxy-6-hydroxymethyldihydropteridine diphosphokinase [Aestuariirhabdus litorea]